jgi:hypothetical protein
MALGDDGSLNVTADSSSPGLTLGGGSSGLNAAGWGTLGLGALSLGGLGYMLGQGPPTLPQQFVQAEQQVPTLQNQSALTFGQGQQLVGQAGVAYDMAQRGQLTPEQQAQLAQTRQGLENQARQTYANMGRDFGRDTSAISTEQNIDQATTAMAQSYIQSTIALATSQMQAGQSLIGDSLQESSAATNILMAAGAAQIQLDKQYSDSITGAFGAIGKVFGAVAPTLLKAALV